MENMMTVVETTCPCCGAVHILVVPVKGLREWEQGMCVQHAFPHLTPNERELLITGICADCWDSAF